MRHWLLAVGCWLLAIDSFYNILVNLRQLTFSHVCRRIGLVEPLSETFDGYNTMRVRKECQLVQILFGAIFRLGGSDQTHQHRVLYIGFNLDQNSTLGALDAPSSASKYGFFSNPHMPARMLFGKRRIFVL